MRLRTSGSFVRVSIGAVALVLGLGACSEPSLGYVEDEETNTYFSVPVEWNVYSQAQLDPAVEGANPFQTQGNPVLFRAGFASPGADIAPADIGQIGLAEAPVGYALVFQLTDSEADTFSPRAMRNRLYAVDQWFQEDPNSVVLFSAEPIQLEGGYRGERIVFSRRSGSDPASPYGDSWTATQSAILDPTGTIVYYFVAGCRSDCYLEHQSVIDGIVATWSVTP